MVLGRALVPASAARGRRAAAARRLGYDRAAAPVLTRTVLHALLQGSVTPDPVAEILTARHLARPGVRAEPAFGEHTTRFVTALAGRDRTVVQQTALRALRLAQTDGWSSAQFAIAVAIHTELGVPPPGRTEPAAVVATPEPRAALLGA